MTMMTMTMKKMVTTTIITTITIIMKVARWKNMASAPMYTIAASP
jgi:hypothetical protein